MSPRAPALLLPEAPALVAGAGRAVIVTAEGEVLELPRDAAIARLRTLPPPLVVHGPATLRRLGLRGMKALDLLELFAFTHPARPAAPTPLGLALALDITPPRTAVDAAAMLPDLLQAMLARLAAGRDLPAN